jgi:peptidoglycan/xylan/chitin deacetylase (PgdA/CDA1 family)
MNIIMFHYVRPYDQEYPYFNYLDLNNFKKELDFFEKEYGFLSKDEFFYSIENSISTDGVILTFDDGFKDHYTYVLPELKKRNLWGLFYIPTKVFSTETLLGVHRIHYLKGKYGSDRILKDTIMLVEEHMLDKETIKEFDKEIYKGANYGKDEKKLRRLFNYYISYNYRDAILDKLMSKYFDEKKLHNNLYLNLEEVLKIKRAGSIIGAHSVTHKVLSRLSYREQEDEIKDSLNFLREKVGVTPPYSFCYPYGYKASYNNDTIKILKNNQVNNATVFDNKSQILPVKRFELSRIDCNKFLES